MKCNHTRLKSVDCVLYCIDCGVKLPEGRNAQPNGDVQKGAPKAAKKKTKAAK